MRALLGELEPWQRARGFPFELYTEASVNLAAVPPPVPCRRRCQPPDRRSRVFPEIQVVVVVVDGDGDGDGDGGRRDGDGGRRDGDGGR